MRVYKFEIIIKNPCWEGFDEDPFIQNLLVFKIIYILSIFYVYQTKHYFSNKFKSLASKLRKCF